jgi:hypothetical protein
MRMVLSASRDARQDKLNGTPECILLGLADFVCSVQPGTADGVTCDGGNHLIEGEAGWQPGNLGEGEELENVGVGSV